MVSPVGLMERDTFAQHVGVEPGIVEGWIRRGYIPSTLVGRHRLVNLVLLHKRLLHGELGKEAEG